MFKSRKDRAPKEALKETGIKDSGDRWLEVSHRLALPYHKEEAKLVLLKLRREIHEEMVTQNVEAMEVTERHLFESEDAKLTTKSEAKFLLIQVYALGRVRD